MKKTTKLILAITIMASSIMTARADGINDYYTNENGVSFTQEEYNFLNNFYYEGYLDKMTEETYNEFKKSNIINGEIKTTEKALYEEQSNSLIMPYSSGYHESPAKIIRLSTSCSSTECFVAITLTWKKDPTIKSYDVLGARFSGISYKSAFSTIIEAGSSTYYVSTAVKNLSNGIGQSFKLPTTSETIIIQQSFYTTKGGSITASYQHAKKTSKLSYSQNYTFGSSGYGRVFVFHSEVKDYYDAMDGVTLSV